MNRKQALAYAKKRWGKTGGVSDANPKHRPRSRRYRVGRVVMGLAFEVCGYGSNWQEAVDSVPNA